MYVAMLDRPWLETPFVFQGFEIHDKFEIELLQSYCRYVYVDVDRGKMSATAIRALIASRKAKPSPLPSGLKQTHHDKGWLARFRALILRVGLGRLLISSAKGAISGYKISSTVRGEAALANDAYDQLSAQHRSILERASQEGLVDMEGVAKAVTPTIESVLRNPNAIAWTIFSRKRGGRYYNRAVATSVWAIMFGRQLGFDREALQDLAVGGLLLDIGNVNLSADILNMEGAITIE